VVSSTPGPHYTAGKDPVPILQEAGWATGPVWTGGKSRPHRDSIPDCPARSSVSIPTELPDLARRHRTGNPVTEVVDETLLNAFQSKCENLHYLLKKCHILRN